MTTAATHASRYRTYRTIGIVLIVLGAVLIPFFGLGLLVLLPGIFVLASARGQLKTAAMLDAANFEPFAFDRPLDVVGESNYAKHIRAIYTATGSDPARAHTALLVHDKGNKRDSNAVIVLIPHAGTARPVGYLPRATAAAAYPLVAAAASRGKTPTVAAMIGEPFVADDGHELQQVRIYTTA